MGPLERWIESGIRDQDSVNFWQVILSTIFIPTPCPGKLSKLTITEETMRKNILKLAKTLFFSSEATLQLLMFVRSSVRMSSL